MKLPKLPAPPLPNALQPKPPRPGEREKTTPVDQAKEAGIAAVDWIDERTSLSGGLRWTMFRKVPKGTNWFYMLGSATMFAFLSQAVTGVFLAMYYRPDVAGGAYESVRHLTNEVFLGEFVRGMHKWGSTVMVILIFLHMGRTFFFGAYKYPRELNWVIGVVLLVLTLVMSFTGYLLPFDQRSYWATIVGVNINGTGPLLGPFLSDFLRAGPDFGATTLSRFYAIHMLLVPGALAALIGAHPYAVAKDSAMAVVVLASIVVMAIVLGAELGPKADPTTTTYVTRPEWYFFFLFEVLRVIKPPELVPLATIGIPTIAMVLLLLLPFYDRNPERLPQRRPIATTAGILTIVAMAYLTYLGASAGAPDKIEMEVAAEYEEGKQFVAQSGCLACHKIGENGNDGPGPELTDIGNKLPKAAILRTLENPTAPMPSFAGLPQEKKTAMVDFLAQLRGE